MSEYIVMIDHKTGGFFRLVMRLIAAEASSSIPSNNKLDSFITLLGRYYQIRDGYQNLTSDEVCSQYFHQDPMKQMLQLSFQFDYPLIIR